MGRCQYKSPRSHHDRNAGLHDSHPTLPGSRDLSLHRGTRELHFSMLGEPAATQMRRLGRMWRPGMGIEKLPLL